jgi:hypothetical protein
VDLTEQLELAAPLCQLIGGKDQLLVTVLRAIDRRALAQIGSDDTPTTRDAFLRWADVARWCEGEGRAITLLSVRMETENVLGSDLARDHFAARDRSIHRLLVTMLRDGIRRNDLRADIDIEAKAAEMLAFRAGRWFFSWRLRLVRGMSHVTAVSMDRAPLPDEHLPPMAPVDVRPAHRSVRRLWSLQAVRQVRGPWPLISPGGGRVRKPVRRVRRRPGPHRAVLTPGGRIVARIGGCLRR